MQIDYVKFYHVSLSLSLSLSHTLIYTTVLSHTRKVLCLLLLYLTLSHIHRHTHTHKHTHTLRLRFSQSDYLATISIYFFNSFNLSVLSILFCLFECLYVRPSDFLQSILQACHWVYQSCHSNRPLLRAPYQVIQLLPSRTW